MARCSLPESLSTVLRVLPGQNFVTSRFEETGVLLTAHVFAADTEGWPPWG
jgi:hypothetical protein